MAEPTNRRMALPDQIQSVIRVHQDTCWRRERSADADLTNTKDQLRRGQTTDDRTDQKHQLHGAISVLRSRRRSQHNIRRSAGEVADHQEDHPEQRARFAFQRARQDHFSARHRVARIDLAHAGRLPPRWSVRLAPGDSSPCRPASGGRGSSALPPPCEYHFGIVTWRLASARSSVHSAAPITQ